MTAKPTGTQPTVNEALVDRQFASRTVGGVGGWGLEAPGYPIRSPVPTSVRRNSSRRSSLQACQSKPSVAILVFQRVGLALTGNNGFYLILGRKLTC